MYFLEIDGQDMRINPLQVVSVRTVNDKSLYSGMTEIAMSNGMRIRASETVEHVTKAVEAAIAGVES